jgi:hypothetical protein
MKMNYDIKIGNKDYFYIKKYSFMKELYIKQQKIEEEEIIIPDIIIEQIIIDIKKNIIYKL